MLSRLAFIAVIAFLAFVVPLSLWGASTARAEEPPYSHMHLSRVHALRDRVGREVVIVEALRPAHSDLPGGETRYDGGGVYVGDGRVLTSAFFVAGARELRVRLPGGDLRAARLERVSRSLGLALLEIGAA